MFSKLGEKKSCIRKDLNGAPFKGATFEETILVLRKRNRARKIVILHGIKNLCVF